jgi:hypothetical protein
MAAELDGFKIIYRMFRVPTAQELQAALDDCVELKHNLTYARSFAGIRVSRYHFA